MKKFFAGIAAAAIITVPMTSFALESMSKGALKKATGQAGVAIAVDDIVIIQKTPTTIYWDNDGVAGTGTIVRAGVEISFADDSYKMTTIDGIVDNADTYGFSGGYGVANISSEFGTADIGIAETATTGAPVVTSEFATKIAPLTIDVGTCKALTEGVTYNNTGMAATTGVAATNVVGVVIGLPTVEISNYFTNNVKSIKVLATDAAGNTATSANGGRELIAIEKKGVQRMAILGGRLEIAPH